MSYSRSLLSFVSQVTSALSKDDIARFLFLGKDCLFIAENFVEPFTRAYTEHLMELAAGGSLVSVEKAHKKLFPAGLPPVQYIFPGKQPLPVIELPLEQEAGQKIPIQRYQGEPLKTINFLHPKDPLLVDSEVIEYSQGMFAVKRRDKKQLAFDQELAVKAKEILGQFPAVLEKYPGAKESLRYTVLAFGEILQRARSGQQNGRPVLVPQNFDRKKHLVWTAGKVYLLQERESHRILDIFTPFGESGAKFLADEIQNLKTSRSKKSSYRVVKGGKVLLDTFHKPAAVDAKTVRDFFGRALKTSLSKRFRRFSTVKDVLAVLAESLKQAAPLPDHHLTGELKDKVRPGELVLKQGAWRYIISRRSDVRQIIFLGALKREGHRQGRKKRSGRKAKPPVEKE